jgi:hypothetical protein
MATIMIDAQTPNTTSTSPRRWNIPPCLAYRRAILSKYGAEKVCKIARMNRIAATHGKIVGAITEFLQLVTGMRPV